MEDVWGTVVKAYCVLSVGTGVAPKSFAAPIYLVAWVALALFAGRHHTDSPEGMIAFGVGVFVF